MAIGRNVSVFANIDHVGCVVGVVCVLGVGRVVVVGAFWVLGALWLLGTFFVLFMRIQGVHCLALDCFLGIDL